MGFGAGSGRNARGQRSEVRGRLMAMAEEPSTLLVLTAAGAAQARGYRAQLAAREADGTLGPGIRWFVAADPRGRRVGSGGATFAVLWRMARHLFPRSAGARSLAGLFAGRRIIVIHSGGDSRRLCAYAAQGKVFTPLPCDHAGRPAALFDLMLAGLLALPAPRGGQVLVSAGDVLLTFDPRRVDFDRPGFTGVAYQGTLERGRGHGVYVADRCGRVVDFLQKPDEATARRHHAVDGVGRVLVDTGLLSLDPSACAGLLELAGVRWQRGGPRLGPGMLSEVLAGTAPPLDLYEHLLMALPRRTKRAAYLAAMEAAHTPEARDASRDRARLTRLHQGLHGRPFHVNVLPYCDFFHIGATRELVSNLAAPGRHGDRYGLRNQHRAAVAAQSATEGAFIYNALIDSRHVRLGPGVLIESVHCDRAVQLPGPNVVVGWPRAAGQALRLPAGWGLVCLPVRGGHWSVVLFGLDDDFKTDIEAGGTFGGHPMAEAFARLGLERSTVFGPRSARATLWDARLWSVGPLTRVLDRTLWLCARRPAMPPGWQRRARRSMRQLLAIVDHERLIRHRTEIQRLGDLHSVGKRLAADPWLSAADIVGAVRDGAEALSVGRIVSDLTAVEQDPLRLARLHRLAELLVERQGPRRGGGRGRSADLSRSAFEAVAHAVAREVSLPDRPRPAAIRPDQVVWATTPVRLDFAGGWSDTPPICTELGGTVLNAAIMLNGQYPVQVVAKLADRPVITLNSIDLSRHVELDDTRQVLAYRDPSDWAALPKAALVLAGLCPRDPRQRLDRWLERFGGGLSLTLFAALPKGSGLGTSSILGAAVLAALARVCGESVSNDALVERTSVLEQIMTTGGGWQDQVGGITPGVKLARTGPGPRQAPSLQWTGFGGPVDHPWREQMLLYYTGCQRLARNILQNVVGRYLARDPHAIGVIHELKAGAEQMKEALDARDLAGFARGVDRYWELKKSLDPGATNPGIEGLLAPLKPLLLARLLPGAGGGGFVFMVARDVRAAARVRAHLAAHPPNRLARFFDFQIDETGLKLTVL